MALLSPEIVPVKMYKWDDVGAPELKKTTANGVAEIFKACLVVGYGQKAAAGWTMPYESLGIKVFRPQVGTEIDFYLRMSADNGRQVEAGVYQNMIDANTGSLKLKCAQQFKYARGTTSKKWLLVASPRGVWFFCEQAYHLDDTGISGAYFFVGDTMRDNTGLKALFMQHTGGSYNDGGYSNIFGKDRVGGVAKESTDYVYGALLNSAGDVYVCDTESLFGGSIQRTTARVLAPLIIIANKTLYQLPGLTVPSDGPTKRNFDTQKIAMDGYVSDIITFNTGPSLAANFCISTDIWSY